MAVYPAFYSRNAIMSRQFFSDGHTDRFQVEELKCYERTDRLAEGQTHYGVHAIHAKLSTVYQDHEFL